MYCVKCGVELGDSEKHCPLCHTEVYYKERDVSSERPYPEFTKPETVNPRGMYFVFSALYVLVALISFFCDYNLYPGIQWAGYVIGGLILSYSAFILPHWFDRRHQEIFYPVFFALVAGFLWYINYTLEDDWFMTLALPVTGAIALVVCSVFIILKYIRHGRLYLFGGAFIGLGLTSVLAEYLISVTFGNEFKLFWSPYPLISLTLVGLTLLVIAIVKPFKESLRRIFTI